MNVADHGAGTGASSPLQVPPAGWLAILKRTWKEMGDDNIGIIAAGIAFYVFAAIVPTLGAVVLSYGLFAEAETVRRNIEGVFASLPKDAASIISDQLLTVVESSNDKQGIGLVVALLLAWYGATKGSAAIITGLNVAYDTDESRGFVRLNLLKFAVVAGGVLMIFAAIGTTMLLAFLSGLIPNAPVAVLAVIRVVGFMLLAVLVVTAAAILFRFGPDHRQPRWIWLSPGSGGATLLWLAGTAGFGFYVSNFGNYGATYGSLSAVIVTLTWLWLTAYVFLLGAELNAELERQVEGKASNVDPALNDQLVPTAVQSPEIPQFEPVAGKRHAPVSTLIDFAGNGAIATVGFAMLRRGRPVGILAIAFAAMVAWRKRPPEMGNADA
ncbi:YihY/virulence factor BrkB family protein [Sphingomonas sp. Leaf67]|uniref:YihY/virulence factor BrkB family protein n=1 Tax=Sphingomonas sp. Leaf67 TaxID=1736230 RepID=UPI000A49D28E|nr:YihY/virulence factor BrkB family protein [Sphingomonas sp. Leaf67]